MPKLKSKSSNHPSNRPRRRAKPRVRIPVKKAKLPRDPMISEVREGRTLRKLLRYAKLAHDDARAENYEALLGCEPHGELLSSNFVEQRHLVNAVDKDLRALRKEQEMEIGLQFEHFEVVPASHIDVSVKTIKSKSKVYAKAGVSSIRCLHFLDVPLADDPLGFGIRPVMAAVLFGPRIKYDIEVLTRGSKIGQRKPDVEWIEASKKAQVTDAVKRVLAPKLVGEKASLDAAARVGIDDWMKNASLRAFVKLQVLSVLPLRKRVYGDGRGTHILEPALRAAELRLKTARQWEEPGIHRDGVQHFWFGEIQRLKFEEFSLPFIRLR